MTFGDNLKAARERKHLTQLEVASLLGISKSAYCGYENDSREPNLDRIRRLAAVLDTPVDALLETDFCDNGPDPDEVHRMQAAFWGGDRELTQEDRDVMWADVAEYAAFRAEQQKRRKQNGAAD